MSHRSNRRGENEANDPSANHFAIVNAMVSGTIYDLEELSDLRILSNSYLLTQQTLRKPLSELETMGYIKKMKRGYDDVFFLDASASTLKENNMILATNEPDDSFNSDDSNASTQTIQPTKKRKQHQEPKGVIYKYFVPQPKMSILPPLPSPLLNPPISPSSVDDGKKRNKNDKVKAAPTNPTIDAVVVALDGTAIQAPILYHRANDRFQYTRSEVSNRSEQDKKYDNDKYGSRNEVYDRVAEMEIGGPGLVVLLLQNLLKPL